MTPDYSEWKPKEEPAPVQAMGLKRRHTPAFCELCGRLSKRHMKLRNFHGVQLCPSCFCAQYTKKVLPLEFVPWPKCRPPLEIKLVEDRDWRYDTPYLVSWTTQSLA